LRQEIADDLNIDSYPYSLKEKTLNGMWRDHVVHVVKAPLAKAIILAAKLLPARPTRKNCREHNTRILYDIRERFLEGVINPRLHKLYEASLDIILFEMEHDVVEMFVLNYFAEEIAKEINNGNWIPNNGGCPQPGIWRE